MKIQEKVKNMVKILDSGEKNFNNQLESLLNFDTKKSKILSEKVEKILFDVKTWGDEALMKYSEQFDNYKSTFSCIESILKSDNLNFHIVIVNNNVLTDSFKDLKKTFSNNKDISLLNLNANLGYAGGLNKGIKFSLNNPDCKYLWLLNNDV